MYHHIRAIRDIYKEIKLQKKYNESFLIPYLNELEIKYNGKFSDEQRNKIINYYGLFITSFLCSNYKKLYGKRLSNEERKRATLFGILTPVGDDLFDIDKLDIEDIKTITYHPETFNATTFSSQVAKEIQTFLLNNVPHREAYLEASKNVLDIQIATVKQTDKNISQPELEHITYTKGAVSVTIYHQCLDDVADAQMEEVLFYIGSLYQLGNDIFDIYKDVRDNIYTLINTCTDFTAFKNNFLRIIQIQNQKIMALPYAKKNKKEFCIIMNSINARSLVALDQFISFQKKAGEIDWQKMQRKDMIVDMEKTKNIIRWFFYTIKLSRLK